MWGLYKDPEGTNVLKGMVQTVSNTNLPDTGSVELATLQTRIRELEQKLLETSCNTNCTTLSHHNTSQHTTTSAASE